MVKSMKLPNQHSIFRYQSLFNSQRQQSSWMNYYREILKREVAQFGVGLQ